MNSLLTSPLLAQAQAQDSASTAAVWTFSIYIVAVMVLAWLSNRLLQSKSFLSEYFLGSRSLGVWAFALTFAATSSSGGSFIGFPSLVYTHGWIVGLWIGSYMIVPIVSMGLLAKRINQIARKTGAITIPDVLRDRFDSPLFGSVATGLIVFFMVFNLIAQFKGGSVILQTLLKDVPLFRSASNGLAEMVQNVPILSASADNPGYLFCLLVFTFAVVVYTAYGGFRAVVWTDVMQGFVMVGGVMLMLPLALYAVGGLGNATRQMAEMTPPRNVAIGFALDEPLPDGAAAISIPKNAWIVQADEAGKSRVFRIAARALISPGERFAEVSGIEITYEPHHQDIQTHPAAAGLDLVILQQVSLHLEHESPPAEGLLVPKGTAFMAGIPSLGSRLVKTTADAEFPPGTSQAIVAGSGSFGEPDFNIPAMETLSADFPAQAPGAPTIASSVVSAADYVPYAYGDGQKGVYVTGPGPHASKSIGFHSFSLAVSFFFMWTFSGAGQPSNMVRLMAFNSATTLRRAIFTVSIYYTLIYFPLVIIFCCARVLLPGWETESDRIMPEMARATTAMINMPWLAGLLVAAPFAAVMSTMDSFLLMISSAVVRDIYQRSINPHASEKTIKRLTYFVTVAIGSIAMLAAVSPPQFLQDIIVFTGSGLSTSFLAPVTLMLYWPRFNRQGALAGMLGGFGTHVTLYTVGTIMAGKVSEYYLFGYHPFIVGLVASLVFAVAGTLLTAPPPEHLVRKYFYKDG